MLALVLMRYGYHGPYALLAALENERRTQFWQEYVADLLGLYIGRMYDGITLFSEIMNRGRGNEKPMTTDEIFDAVLGKLDQLAG